MSDFGTMIARIEDEIDNEDLTDQVKKAITSAIAHHSRRQFWFNRVRFDFAVVADDEFFDSTDDSEIPNIVQIDSAWLVQSSIRYPLVQVNDNVIADSQTGLVKSRPTNFSYVRKQIHIYPISDDSYTFYAEAWSRLSELTNVTVGAVTSDATNAWMTDGEELIRQRAKYILAIDIIHDEALAMRANGAEREALDALISETARRRGRQFLRVDPALVPRGGFDINTGDY